MFIHKTWVFLGLCNAVTLKNVPTSWGRPMASCEVSNQWHPFFRCLLSCSVHNTWHYKSWSDGFSLVPSGDWGREYSYKDYLWKDRDPSGTRARGVVLFHGIEELHHWYNGIIYTPFSAEIHLFKDPCFIRAELQPFSTHHNLLLWPATPQTEMGGAQMLL